MGNGAVSVGKNGVFRARNPATGADLEPAFRSATAEEVNAALRAAEAAMFAFAATSGRARGELLRAVAEELTANLEAIVARANLETGLPAGRLHGEMSRTTDQLRMFAEVVEEGSWVDARIDEALPERRPSPRPDVRSMLRPLGPVAVFGAGTFSLAFAVAGGDTASALAAGCPVVVKAHPAHPGTSQLVATAIRVAVQRCELPAGVFGLLLDAGVEVEEALVQHPATKAVAFTGPGARGRDLMGLAAQRPEPIPCFAEMGSAHLVVVLPHAMEQRGVALVAGLRGALTPGSGPFWSKPGLVFLPKENSGEFLDALRASVSGSGVSGPGFSGPGGQQGLTSATAVAPSAGGLQGRPGGQEVSVDGPQSAAEGTKAGASTAFRSVPLERFLVGGDPDGESGEGSFGPTTVLVHYGQAAELVEAAQRLHGHLFAAVYATEGDLLNARELLRVLETKVGRVLFNGLPTDVEVCPAMVHGGPFPATSDARWTSIGARAMLRFARPVCYQDFPDAALPKALQRGNPLRIQRMLNGVAGQR